MGGGRRRGKGQRERKHNDAIVTDNSGTKSSDEPLMVRVSHGDGSKTDWSWDTKRPSGARPEITERSVRCSGVRAISQSGGGQLKGVKLHPGSGGARPPSSFWPILRQKYVQTFIHRKR